MFDFCRSVKKWIVAVIIWSHLQLSMAYAAHSLWFEIDRQGERQELMLKISHANTALAENESAKALLANYNLTFEDRDVYQNDLSHNQDHFIFQGRATPKIYKISLSQGNDTQINFIVYKEGRVVVNALKGLQDKYQFKTYGSLITALDPDLSTSVHTLTLTGQNVINQQDLKISHAFDATAIGIGEGQGQILNQGFIQANSLKSQSLEFINCHDINVRDHGIINTSCFNNCQSMLQSGQQLEIKTKTFNNEGGWIWGYEPIKIEATKDFFNYKGIIKSPYRIDLVLHSSDQALGTLISPYLYLNNSYLDQNTLKVLNPFPQINNSNLKKIDICLNYVRNQLKLTYESHDRKYHHSYETIISPEMIAGWALPGFVNIMKDGKSIGFEHKFEGLGTLRYFWTSMAYLTRQASGDQKINLKFKSVGSLAIDNFDFKELEVIGTHLILSGQNQIDKLTAIRKKDTSQSCLLEIADQSITTVSDINLSKGKTQIKGKLVLKNQAALNAKNNSIVIFPEGQLEGSLNEGQFKQLKCAGQVNLLNFQPTEGNLIVDAIGRVYIQSSAKGHNVLNQGLMYLPNHNSHWGLLINKGLLWMNAGHHYVKELRNFGTFKQTLSSIVSKLIQSKRTSESLSAMIPAMIMDIWTKKGIIDAPNDVYIHLSDNKIDDLQVRGNLSFSREILQNLSLEDLKDIKVTGQLRLYKNNFVHTNTLQLDNIHQIHLNAISATFLGDLSTRSFIGKFLGNVCFGRDNNAFGKLRTTQGKLDLEGHEIDARFGQIEGAGETILKSRQGNFLIGNARAVIGWHSAPSDTNWLQADSFEKYVYNGSYIKSYGPLTLEATNNDILICYGQVLPVGQATLRAKTKIYNLSGRISSLDTLFLYGQHYLQERPPLAGYGAYSPNPNYQHLMYYLDCADEAILETLKDVHFNTQSVTNIASHLLIGGKAYHNGVSQTAEATRSTFINQSVNKYYTELEVGTGRWYTHNDRVGHTPAVIKIGESLNINSGLFETSGSISAPQIHIKVHQANITNPFHTRSTRDTHQSIVIDVNTFLENLTKNPGYIPITLNPTVSALNFPKLFLNPLPDAPIHNPFATHDLNYYLFKAFSETTGSAFMRTSGQTVSGHQLVQQLCQNTERIKRELGDQPATPEKIAEFGLSCLYQSLQQAKDINDGLVQRTEMLVTGENISPYQLPGDTTGDTFDLQTTGDVKNVSSRIVMKESVNILAGGTLERRTGKYLKYYQEGKKQITQEMADPQETIVAKQGNVHVVSQGNYTETGSVTQAGGDLTRGSGQGTTTVQPLTLKTTTEQKSKKRGLFSNSSKITVTGQSSHVPSETKVGVDSHITSAKGIYVTGSKERVGRDLYFEGQGNTIVEAASAITQTTTTTTTSSWLGSGTNTHIQQSPELTPASLQVGGDIYFKTPKAHLKGAHIVADTLYNYTTEQLIVGPKIIEIVQRFTSQMGGAFGAAHQDHAQGQEVACDSVLAVNRIVSALETSLLFESTDDSTRWLNHHKPITEGAYQESLITLKTWRHSESSCSGIYDPNIASLVSLAVTLAVTYLTFGTGSSAAAALTSEMIKAAAQAGVTHVCSQGAVTFLQNNGDLLKTAQILTSEASLRTLATTMVTAGATQGLQIGLKLPSHSRDLLVNAKKASIHAAVGTVAQTVINGQDLADSLRTNINAGIVNTVGQTLASRIGDAYTDANNPLSYGEHKGLHFVAGATTGALQGCLDGSNIGMTALSRGTGAAFGHTLAELSEQQFGTSTDSQRDRRLYADLGILGAGLSSLPLNLNTSITVAGARDAVDYNFSKHPKKDATADDLDEKYEADDKASDGYDTDDDAAQESRYAKGRQQIVKTLDRFFNPVPDPDDYRSSHQALWPDPISDEQDRDLKRIKFDHRLDDLVPAAMAYTLVKPVKVVANFYGQLLEPVFDLPGRVVENTLRYMDWTSKGTARATHYMINDVVTVGSLFTGRVSLMRATKPMTKAPTLLFNVNRSHKVPSVAAESGFGVDSTQLTVPKLIEVNRQKGFSFQQAVQNYLRIDENFKVYSANVPGRGLVNTRPDLPIQLAGVSDIKNVINISFTTQLRAQAALALEKETSFNLIISPNTETISKPLVREIYKLDGKIFEFNSVTQQMIERIVEGNKVVR